MTISRGGTKMTNKRASKRRPRTIKVATGSGAGVKKIGWTQQEDERLLAVLDDHDLKKGKISWISISDLIEYRSAKQCRLRWYNHLRPDVKRSEWTDQEKLTLFEIAKTMQRSEGDVKNRWNTKGFRELRKALSETSVQRMSQLIVAGHAGFPVELLSGTVAIGTSSRDLIQGETGTTIPSADRTPCKICAASNESADDPDWVPCETSVGSDDSAYNSLQPDLLIPSKSRNMLLFASSKDNDKMQDGDYDDDSIAGLIAQEMCRELPPLSIAPSPSWGIGEILFEKFNTTSVVNSNMDAAYQWPTPKPILFSPVSHSGAPIGGRVETFTPSVHNSYIHHV